MEALVLKETKKIHLEGLDELSEEELEALQGLYVCDVKDNMQGVIPRLPLISIAHQGGVFKFPQNPDGKIPKMEEFTGVIIDNQVVNAYWEKPISETGGGEPPDCFSMDGIKGQPDCPCGCGGNCARCDYNQFGSSSGGAKACKNMRRLAILMEGHTLPYRISLPPTSIKALDTYLTSLTDQGLPYGAVVTRFSLKSVRNRQGIEYSEVVFSIARRLSAKEYLEVKKLKDEYRPIIRGQRIEADEYVTQDDVPF